MVTRGSVLLILMLNGIVCFSQSLNTEMRGNWDDNSLPSTGSFTYNDIWGYADASGREYAIMGSRSYTHFIDVTDPENPIEVDRELGSSNCLWRDFKVYGNYAYGVADCANSALEIYDLSHLPDSVHRVYDSQEFFSRSHNIFIDTAAKRLYACGFLNDTNDIVVLDLSVDPANPSLGVVVDLKPELGSSDGYVHDLHVRNDTIFAAHIYQKIMTIYDFSDLENINTNGIGSLIDYTGRGLNHSNWLTEDGKTLVMADETRNSPIKLIDVSDPTQPDEISNFKSSLLPDGTSLGHNPFVIGNDFVVMSYYDDGLQIFKIDSLLLPFLAGYYDTDTSSITFKGIGSWGTYPYLPSGNLLASDVKHGLFIITPQFPLRDCQENVMIKGVYDSHWSFIAQDTFRTDANYINNGTFSFIARDEIELVSGFSIELGTELSAIIEDHCIEPQALGQERPTKPNQKE